MMYRYRKLTAAVLLAAGVAFFSGTASGESFYDPEKDAIIIKGSLNTLSSVAKEINNPAVFSYDRQTKRAFCHKSVHIQGNLFIKNETLEMGSCENPRPQQRGNIIHVHTGGKLSLEHAEIYAPSYIYEIWSWGIINMSHSKLTHCGLHSDRSFRLEKDSETVLKDTVLDVIHIYIVSPEAKVHIEKCDFTRSRYNFRLVSGVTVSLIDCKAGKFPPMEHLGSESRILIKKNVVITLMDESGSPISGVLISAVSRNRDAVEFSENAQTDKNGKVKIPMAFVDYDDKTTSTFFRSRITAQMDSKVYILKNNWKPDKQELIFKKNCDFAELEKGDSL